MEVGGGGKRGDRGQGLGGGGEVLRYGDYHLRAL